MYWLKTRILCTRTHTHACLPTVHTVPPITTHTTNLSGDNSDRMNWQTPSKGKMICGAAKQLSNAAK